MAPYVYCIGLCNRITVPPAPDRYYGVLKRCLTSPGKKPLHLAVAVRRSHSYCHRDYCLHIQGRFQWPKWISGMAGMAGPEGPEWPEWISGMAGMVRGDCNSCHPGTDSCPSGRNSCHLGRNLCYMISKMSKSDIRAGKSAHRAICPWANKLA